MMPYGYGAGFGGRPQYGYGPGQMPSAPMGFGPTWPGAFAPMGFGPTLPGTFAPMGLGYGAGVGPGPFPPWWTPTGLGWGLGGGRRWGGTYSPQFVTTGLPTDEEITEMVYDAIDADPLIPFDADIAVDTDAGTVTLTGTVTSKQIKHAAGDDTWWIPGVDDVRNEMQVVPRRGAREEAAEAPPAPAAAGTRLRR